MTCISSIFARQILDSRGRPTVEADITLDSGACGRASVPSGASTGKAEALELRDGGEAWSGLGTSRAVANVRDIIAPALIGRDIGDQAGLDAAMRELDGTDNLARLGANATLAVSLAAVRASAAAANQPLFRRIADLAGTAPTMPMPMVNILSGGLHAGRGMDVQDFLMIPIGATSYAQALDWVCRVRLSATTLCVERGITTLLADEGGLSPGFAASEDALDLMVNAFVAAGLEPGRDAVIALDIASSSLIGANGLYRFERLGRDLDPAAMIDMQTEWVERYPIVSIEDGLGEEDWGHWPAMTARLNRIQLVGDDLFATQPVRIERGVASAAANAALIKVNQNGTFSGTLDAIAAARKGGYATVISARSGETEDDFLADFAVGVAGGQIKIGSVRNSERLAKYNQLLRLEEAELAWCGKSGIAPL
ncbi:MAG: phosphopyruvate hydratase [Novosphingobium sp.]|uniref:phosphopyruvate hydratase n=1 Tax=Novosphingobium sp. TaxID=1874826 RepID=UPI00301B564B